MYKIVSLYKICFVLLFSNLLFSDQIETAYNFDSNDTKGIVDELRIDFSYLKDSSISPENSLYIYINNTIESGIVSWDEPQILLNTKNTNTTLYQIKTENTILTKINNVYDIIEKDNVYVPMIVYEKVYNEDSFGGSASSKINNQIFIHKVDGKNLLIEIPLLESINSDDMLRIFDLPINLSSNNNAYAQFQIGYMLNSDILESIGKLSNINDLNKNLVNTNAVVLKSELEISLLKDYKFNDSKLPLPITFQLQKNENVTFPINQHFKFSLNEQMTFFDEFSEVIIVANNKEIDKNDYDIFINGGYLNFILNKNIDASKISFKKILVKSKGRDSESTVKVSAKFDKNNNDNTVKKKRRSKNDIRSQKEFIFVSESDESVNIHDIDFWFLSQNNEPYVIINNEKENHQLPTLLVKQNDNNFINKGDGINIIIPDEVELSWSDQLNIDNPKYSYKRIDDKNIEIKLNESLPLSDTLKINGLKFKNNEKAIPLFNLQTKLLGFDNSNSIFCDNQISIGQISASMDKSQIIFTSEGEPGLSSVVINTDGISSVLQVGDLYYFDLANSSELTYKLDQKIKSNFSKHINFNVDSKKISFEIIKPIPNNSKIIIENILFNKPKKSENTFNLIFGVIPGNYKEQREITSSKVKSDFKIYDININLFKDVELVKNIDVDEGMYDLSDIIIKNNSPFIFNDIDNIVIEFSDCEYSFADNENTKIISSSRKKISYRVSNNKLYISTDNLEKGEKIQVQGLKIKIPSNQISFLKKPIKMTLKTKGQNISIESIKSITFGSPIFRSRDIQLLFENQKIDNAYEIKVDFSEIPISSRRVSDFLIRIPKNIDLKWSDYKQATLEVNNKLYFTSVNITNDGKDVIISIPDDVPKDYRSTITIGSLAFKDIGLKSEEFNLKLSLDKGKTFCALDNIKQIVSESNSVIAIKKIFKEKWYPYKKGNTIEFIIRDDAPFEWDVNLEDIFLKGKRDNYLSDITPKSKMFYDPVISDNNKRISFRIKADIESDRITGAQQMDFGKKLFLNLKVKKTNEDIGVYKNKPFINAQIETIFGKQILKGQKSQGYDNINNTHFKTPKYKHETDNVVLKLELKPDEKLGHPIQINWYRNPTYLLTLSRYKDQDLSIEQRADFLTKGFEELKNFYNKDYDKRYVNQDWTFWYFLAFYKCNWGALQGNDVDYPISGPLASSSINFDLENAEEYGYNPDIPSSYPKPCSEEDSECKLFYENIMASFNNKEYNKAYDILYDEIYVKKRLIGCDVYEILSRYLFAVLSKCVFEDDKIINDKYSFSDYQIKEIKQLLKYGDNYVNYNNFLKSSDAKIKELFAIEDIDIDESCNLIDVENNKNKLDINQLDDFTFNQSTGFKIKWYNQEEAEKNEWKVSFTDKDKLGKDVFLFGALNSEYFDFDERTDMYGSKTYMLNFDPEEKDRKGIWALGLTAATTILFLSIE